MRSTTWEENNQQEICFPDNYFNEKLCRKPKEIKQILIEREK